MKYSLFKSGNRIRQLSKQRNITSILTNKQDQSSVFHLKYNSIPRSKSASAIFNHARMDIDAKSKLRQILDAGLSSVMPSVLIQNKIRYDGNSLIVEDTSYPLTGNVYLVGFGKAVAGMTYALTELLGERLQHGIVSVTELTGSGSRIDLATERDLASFLEIRELETQQLLMLRRSKLIEYLEGARHNQPDDASYSNTVRIVELLRTLGRDDTLIVLTSGGGSALLFAPKPPLGAEEKRELCRRLQNAGASIGELNVVRKQMSTVKGGGLAKLAHPAKVLTLILSDVVGDPLDIIASGPTCPLPSGNRIDAINILKKYNLYDTISEEVRKEIFEKVMYEDISLIKDGKYKFVDNIIIGNNTSALEASARAARKFDVEAVILSNTVEGDVKDVSVGYAQVAKTVCHALEKDFSDKEDFIAKIFKQSVGVLNLNTEKLEKAYKTLMSLREGQGVLLLAGGEPTVVVKGDGKGGRNQQLALQFSLDWLSEIAKNPELARYFVLFFSAASDGQDGPTDAAGVFGQAEIRPKIIQTIQLLKEQKKLMVNAEKLQSIDNQLEEIKKMLPEYVLQRNDAYNFYSKFDKGNDLLKIGLTGTNVMDLHYIYIKKQSCECDIPGVLRNNVPADVGDFLLDKSKIDVNEKKD